MDLKTYHTIWNESWKYFKTYAEQMPMSDGAWNRAIRMTSEFVKHHPEHEAFARAMILVIEKELEERDREMRKENGTWE